MKTVKLYMSVLLVLLLLFPFMMNAQETKLETFPYTKVEKGRNRNESFLLPGKEQRERHVGRLIEPT